MGFSGAAVDLVPNGSSNPNQNKHFTGGKLNLDRSGQSVFGVAENNLHKVWTRRRSRELSTF